MLFGLGQHFGYLQSDFLEAKSSSNSLTETQLLQKPKICATFATVSSEPFQMDSHTVFAVNVGENEKLRGHNAGTLGLFNTPSDRFVSFSGRPNSNLFLPP